MLQRTVTLPYVVLFGVGNILGAGIYVLIGEVAGASGYLTPAAFLLSMILVTFTALSYAEFSARLPTAAGPARFIYEGFHLQWLATTTGLMLVAAGIVSAAVIVNGFYGYLSEFVQLPRTLVIVITMLVLGSIAAMGINQSVKAAGLLTLIELGGLLLIIFVAYESPFLPDAFAATTNEQNTLKHPLAGLIFGAFLAFYAFVGFEDMVAISEEVKEPQRNMPLAILISLGLATVVYLLIALVAVTTVAPSTLADSDAPLATVYEAATGNPATVISLIGLVAVINGALIQIVMGSRILYGMADRGWLPAILASVNEKTRTPLRTTALVVILITGLALAFRVLELAIATNLLLLSVFALVNASLVMVKRRGGQIVGTGISGGMVVPVFIPVCGLLVSLGFLGFALGTMVMG